MRMPRSNPRARVVQKPRDHDHALDASPANGSRHRLRHADHRSRGAEQRSHEPRPPPRELDVRESSRRARAVQRDDERPA